MLVPLPGMLVPSLPSASGSTVTSVSQHQPPSGMLDIRFFTCLLSVSLNGGISSPREGISMILSTAVPLPSTGGT